jgi:hypothetical protein
MPEFIRRQDSHHTHNDWVVVIVVGIIVAGLLGFTASYAKRTLRVSNVPPTEVAGSVTPESKPVLVTKERVRYEAVKENWKRYRSATKPNE